VKKLDAGASEWVEHQAAALGDIKDGVGQHTDRLNRRVQCQHLGPLRPKAIGTCVMPDVASITPELAELNIVEVFASADLPLQHQFVL